MPLLGCPTHARQGLFRHQSKYACLDGMAYMSVCYCMFLTKDRLCEEGQNNTASIHKTVPIIRLHAVYLLLWDCRIGDQVAQINKK